MYLCVCIPVTDSQILDAAAPGATTLEAFGEPLNIATGCGRCAEFAHERLSDHANGLPSQNTLKVA